MAKIGYWNSVGSDKGVPILATVTVYDAGTANKSTIWSDVAGTTLKDNPFQTDTLGRFEFFADPAYYDIEVSGSGITTYKILNQTLGMVGSLVAHATQHKSGGSDPIKLDELAAPTDVTTLDVSTSKHGLCPKLPNDSAKYLNGQGSFAVPAAPGGVVPVGGIIMWSGTIATIPANWALCDGAGGTPDLRDKFVVGAKQDSGGAAKTNVSGSLTQTGGSATHPAHADHASLTHSGTAVADHSSIWRASGPDLCAGSIGHTVTQPNAHPALAHDTPSILNPYYALAFIMRTA